MPIFDVYLEIGPAGECMAHVPALPGCIARGSSRDAALAALPDAIRAHIGWLRGHGEARVAAHRLEFGEGVGVAFLRARQHCQREAGGYLRRHS